MTLTLLLHHVLFQELKAAHPGAVHIRSLNGQLALVIRGPQPACLSVLARHRPLDDWSGASGAEDVLSAMKKEHEVHAAAIPPRVRQLIVAYEVAVSEYRKRYFQLLRAKFVLSQDLGELFLKAYAVTYPNCDSSNIESQFAAVPPLSFHCRDCKRSFQKDMRCP